MQTLSITSYLRENYVTKLFEPIYLGTDAMIADCLTKALDKAKVEKFRSLLGLADGGVLEAVTGSPT
jgi:hypothetical protein